MPTTKRKARQISKDAKSRIGATKTVGGVSYHFNKNYRWERGSNQNNNARSGSRIKTGVSKALDNIDRRILTTRNKIRSVLNKPLV